MRFKVGDKVKILDGRKMPSDIIWVDSMNKNIGKVGEVSHVEEGWGYTVFSDRTNFWYDERWLAPAHDKAKKQNDGVRTALMSSVYTPKRIYKGKGKTVVLWADGTKTIVKRAEGEADNDYAAFTAALAIKVFGTNSEVNRIVKRTEAAEKKRKRK